MATIQGVYVALFGRPADPTGLAFFNTATSNGANLNAIGDLASTPEYQDRFTGQSPAQIITAIYQSLFNRNPEQAGLSFFIAELASGRQSINSIAINILDGAKGDDLATVTAKITAANRFTAEINDPDEIAGYVGNQAAASGRGFLAPITNTSTPPTADQLNAAVDAATAGGTPEVGSTFVLTTAGTDVADITGSFRGNPSAPTDFKFTGGSELVIATSATSQLSDTLTDSSTSDKDVFQLTANAATQLPTTTNIEIIKIAYSAGGNDVDFQGVSGATEVTVTGTAANPWSLLNIKDTGITLVDTTAVLGNGVTANFFGAGSAGITFKGGVGNDVFIGDVGADNLSGGNGIDILVGAGGADVYRGGQGNDTIQLTVDSAADQIILEATKALNGTDNVTDFLTTQDKLDVSAFLGETVSFQAITGGATGPLGGVGAAATPGVNTIWISDTDVTDQATLINVINGGPGQLTLETSSKYVIAIESDGLGDGGPTQLFYVTTSSTGGVDVDTVELVAQVDIQANGNFVAGSFA